MFWRLFGTYGVLWLAAIGVLGWVVVGRVETQYLGQIEDSLRTKAVLLKEIVRGRPATEAPLLQERVEALRREITTRITLMTVDGTVLADSERDPRAYRLENHHERPEVLQADREEFGISRRRHSATVDQDMMYVALRTDDPGGAVAYVRVALPLDRVEEHLSGLRRIVWTAAAATGLAGTLLAFWLARRLTRPLQRLTRGAERIAAGNYGHKVYIAGDDEVGVLARTFNAMSTHLAEQFAQLEEDRQQLRTILSGMIEGVVALDAKQRILFANDRAGQLLGFSPPATAGRKLWEVVRLRSLQEVVRRALAGTEPVSEEVTWSGPSARSLTVHAARLAGPPPRGVVLVLHDTSELRRLERIRQDFVANVSHELKTPLSVIKACVETLIDGAIDDAEHRGPFLEQIDDQAERLHALILDLLSLTRIESGAEAFEFQAVPLEPVVADCLERHRARAEAKGQVLEAVGPGHEGVRGWGSEGVTELGRAGKSASGSPLTLSPSHPLTPSVPAVAWADEEAVSQILDNLVDNAVKYTPAGGRIQVRWHAEDAQVSLEVTDNGIGIPERDLPRIFERFYRVDKARSRELGGTGLGLSIVKHLVQAMHGSVQAASRLGQGTTFFVRLPRAPAS